MTGITVLCDEGHKGIAAAQQLPAAPHRQCYAEAVGKPEQPRCSGVFWQGARFRVLAEMTPRN